MGVMNNMSDGLENTKSFTLLKNGDLQVIVQEDGESIIGVDGVPTKIGVLSQVVTQVVSKDCVEVLLSYVEEQLRSAEEQEKELQKKLDVSFVRFDEELFSETQESLLRDAVSKSRVNVKVLKNQLKGLSEHLIGVSEKRKVLEQLDYIKNQRKYLERDATGLWKVLGKV